MVGSQWNTTRGKRGESKNVCHLLGNFGKRFLTNGTGLENVSEKRSVLELYHLQNTITLLGNDRHFSPSTSTGSLALELVNQSGTKNFGRFGQNGKKVIPERNYFFSGNFPPGWSSIWILLGITVFSRQMVSAPRLSRLSPGQATSQPACHSLCRHATLLLAVWRQKNPVKILVYLIVDNTHYGKNFAAKTLYSVSLSF